MSLTVPVSKALRFLQELRRASPEMLANEAEILLTVARSPGISQHEIAIRTGFGKSTVSRHVRHLSTRKTGRGMIAVQEAADDARRDALTLTAVGEAFVAKLAGFM